MDVEFVDDAPTLELPVVVGPTTTGNRYPTGVVVLERPPTFLSGWMAPGGPVEHLFRRLVPRIAVMAVVVVGVRLLPWDAAGRLVASVRDAVVQVRDSAVDGSGAPSASEPPVVPSVTYPALVPYDGPDPALEVGIYRPGLNGD